MYFLHTISAFFKKKMLLDRKLAEIECAVILIIMFISCSVNHIY